VPATRGDVAHILRRTGFGARPDRIDALAGLERVALVDRVLDTSANPAVSTPDFGSVGEEWRKLALMENWWLARMATTPTPIVEKLALFWHGHFAVSAEKVYDHDRMWRYLQDLRAGSFGSFRDLAQAVAISPMMLEYLDNYLNEAGDPNENFARELMELHTLGVGSYTQDDVVEVARAWTGYGLNDDETQFRFDESLHDPGEKTIFGIRRAWRGPEVIDEITRGSRKTDCARFLARKLFSFFAYPNPDDATIRPIADRLAATDLSIIDGVRALLSGDAFWSDRARNGLPRTPVELVVAAMQATGLAQPDVQPNWAASSMGQRLFHAPNPAGWPNPAAFLTVGGWLARASFARNITWSATDQDKGRTFLRDIERRTPADGAQMAFTALGITDPAPSTRSALEAGIANDRNAERWTQVPNLVTAALLCPDFQMA
jgi:uncharacterized protein (DUF1800 family)